MFEGPPTTLDDHGPRNTLATWMALNLTLATPLVYWVLHLLPEDRTLVTMLQIAIIACTIWLAMVEQHRAKHEPNRHRRGMALVLASVGWVHLAVLIGLVLLTGWFYDVPPAPLAQSPVSGGGGDLGRPLRRARVPVSLARERWVADGDAEYRSVAAFQELGLRLLELGAPFALVEASLRAAIDEVDHARRCYALAGVTPLPITDASEVPR